MVGHFDRLSDHPLSAFPISQTCRSSVAKLVEVRSLSLSKCTVRKNKGENFSILSLWSG